MHKFTLHFLLLLLFHSAVRSQSLDENRMRNIQGILFSVGGSPTQFPVVQLGAVGALGLQFDDLQPGIKSYSYTFQLCDAGWQPVDLSPFDYLNGYTQNRIMNYVRSSIAKVQYMHYSISLPESAMAPSKSGNYLLKVYLNGDTSQLAFTRRFMVLDDKVGVAAQVQQPFDTNKWRTHQKVQFSIDVTRLNVLNPQQQVKVVVLQNNRWDNAVAGMQPAFMRGSQYEYNGERDFLFPAGKEYRWVDLTSFRFFSDRVRNIDRNAFPFQVQVIPDMQRTGVAYLPYQDYDGFYFFKSAEDIDVAMQGDYAKVHFHFYTRDTAEMTGQNVYLVGQFNNYRCDDNSVMHYNPQSRMYDNIQLLKQGYYTYMYVTRPANGIGPSDNQLTEGNYWETENNYTILVYYRSLNNRYDELVSATTINSRINTGSRQ